MFVCTDFFGPKNGYRGGTAAVCEKNNKTGNLQFKSDHESDKFLKPTFPLKLISFCSAGGFANELNLNKLSKVPEGYLSTFFHRVSVDGTLSAPNGSPK